jgi:ABC-2 type transport system permease protein
MLALARVSLALSRRALRNALRRPQLLMPLVLVPTLMLAANVGGLHRTTSLPGFPAVRGFLDFQLAPAMTQSLLFGGVAMGVASALEIEGGFFSRLAVAPIPRVAIVFGRLGAAAAIAVVQMLWFLTLGLVFGAHVKAGVPGLLVTFGIGIVAGIAFAALGVALALRARNASTVQGIFPLVFVSLFVSSAYFPRALLMHPFDTIARYNPLSYVVEGMRAPMIDAVRARPVLEGLAAAVGLTVAAVALSVITLRGRLRQA